MIDYHHKSMNFTKYRPKLGWEKDWNDLFKKINNQNNINKVLGFDLKKSSELAEFDFKDIMILKQLSINGSITLQELSRILGLSKTQIRTRILVLQDKSIIKAFKPIFSPIPKDQMLYIYCFVEVSKYKKEFVSKIFQIPYSFMFIFESDFKFCIRLNISRKDMILFMNGFNSLKKFIDSYFIQFIFENPTTRNPELYDLYNKHSKTWEIDTDGFISKVKSI